MVASTRHMMALLVRVYSLEPVICSPREGFAREGCGSQPLNATRAHI